MGEGDGDSFTGSNADIESAADNLFTSPPHPQPLPFSSLSLKTPVKSVPPTPGTALQQKTETNLEKSLGNSLNIHLQQQMGSFQASMLEAFQSLREELTAKKQTGGSDLVSCFQTWYIQYCCKSGPTPSESQN